MSLTAREIYLTRSLRLIVRKEQRHGNDPLVATLNRNLMSLGFVLSQELTAVLSSNTREEIKAVSAEIIPVLEKMVGAHRKYRPMYPNFPRQVMEASDFELYTNAMMHYWAAAVRDALQGQPRLHGGPLAPGASPTPTTLKVPLRWLPEYEVEDREPLPNEEITLRVIHLGSEADFNAIFTRLAGANGSLSESDKAVVGWFVDNRREAIPLLLPPATPNKENLTYLVGSLLEYEVPTYLLPYLKTATDVLRVAVVLSGGDVSLAANTRFRRFKRKERRFILDALEAVPDPTEDMLRRPEVWKRLGRELRAGDYKARYPKTVQALDVVQNDRPFETYNGRVEASLIRGDVHSVTNLLSERPGDFARRLDHALRTAGPKWIEVVGTFRGVAHRVSTPVLLQAYAHFLHRDEAADHRAFFPKGSVSRVQVAAKPLPRLDAEVTGAVTDTIRRTLVDRFSSLPALGKVYIDPRLHQQFVPFAQRSASKSLRTLVRGSRLAMPDRKAVRFFVWWKEPKGQRTDIDLAAVLFDKDFGRLADVAYYNLQDYGCAHSGDITSAPNGACEFIDVDVDALSEKGVRYVQMVIYSYTQQPFKDLPECFAGWMGRTAVQSGEVFDARTVQDKIDVAGDTTVNIPLVIDLQERQVIWSDIALKSQGAINNSRNNEDNLSRMGKAIASLRKPTLYELFSMHAQGRGTAVGTRDEADTVFGLFEGTVTAFDADKIMSEFMTNGPDQSQVQEPPVVYCAEQGVLARGDNSGA
jgi:hypothetical protein